jgi:hypothetical protein
LDCTGGFDRQSVLHPLQYGVFSELLRQSSDARPRFGISVAQFFFTLRGT